MLKVGIVGLGKMGILHAGIVSALDGISLSGLCETEGIIRRMAEKLIPNVPIYGEVSEMVAKQNLDAVMIAAPIHLHVEIIRTLLEKGSTAIFTEKPLASNLRDAVEAAKAAAGRKVVTMVGYQKRFSPLFQHAKFLLEKQAIGDVQFFKAYSYISDVFRQGSGWRFKKGSGGTLIELGPHLLDLLLWYFGGVSKVSAKQLSLYSNEVEDYVHAGIEFESGTFGAVDVSWSMRNYRLPEICIEIQGTNGVLKVSDDYVQVSADREVRGVVEAGKHKFQKPSFKTNVEFLLGEPEFTVEDRAFLSAVAEKRPTEPNFQDAVKVNELIDRIREAA